MTIEPIRGDCEHFSGFLGIQQVISILVVPIQGLCNGPLNDLLKLRSEGVTEDIGGVVSLAHRNDALNWLRIDDLALALTLSTPYFWPHAGDRRGHH